MSLMTIDPLPIMTSSQTETPGLIQLFAPTNTFDPKETPPHITAPGAIWEKSPIKQSCSIIEFVLTITCFEIWASIFITAPGPTKIPSSKL